MLSVPVLVETPVLAWRLRPIGGVCGVIPAWPGDGECCHLRVSLGGHVVLLGPWPTWPGTVVQELSVHGHSGWSIFPPLLGASPDLVVACFKGASMTTSIRSKSLMFPGAVGRLNVTRFGVYLTHYFLYVKSQLLTALGQWWKQTLWCP